MGDNQQPRRDPPWVRLSDEELLDVRMSELGLNLADTPIAPLVKRSFSNQLQRSRTTLDTAYLLMALS